MLSPVLILFLAKIYRNFLDIKEMSPIDPWSQALLFTGKTSFSSRFFFNIPEIYVQIKNRLNTSLKPELLFIFSV